MNKDVVSRISATERLLNAEGLLNCDVSAEGPRAEIAAIRASSNAYESLNRLAPAIKRLGFQYVAIDLDQVE